jgi:hypothetical protein
MKPRIIETTERPPPGTVRDAIVLYPIAPGEYDVTLFGFDGQPRVVWQVHDASRRVALRRAREIRDAMCGGGAA